MGDFGWAMDNPPIGFTLYSPLTLFSFFITHNMSFQLSCRTSCVPKLIFLPKKKKKVRQYFNTHKQSYRHLLTHLHDLLPDQINQIAVFLW